MYIYIYYYTKNIHRIVHIHIPGIQRHLPCASLGPLWPRRLWQRPAQSWSPGRRGMYVHAHRIYNNKYICYTNMYANM